jgi:oligopeptide transport system substrate-binding protein
MHNYAKKRKLIIALTILIGAAFSFLTGCSKNEEQKSAQINETKAVAESSKPIIFNVQKIPMTIDPALSTDVSAAKVQGACLEGLVKLGKKPGEIIPGVAKSWKVSEDGKEWTFNLRKNAKWSNGDSVTANDFVFGFRRVLEPATAAQYSYMLYYIKNAEQYNKGKIKDFAKVGATAVDDYTLKLDLEKPCPFFLQLITNAIYAPLNEKFYKIAGDKFALEADKLLYNGPWMLTEWIHGGKFVFKKNPYYWNKEFPNVPDMTFLLVPDPNTAANMFRSGNLDMTEISGDQLPQFKDSGEVHTVPSGVYYLQMNTTNKFFKNEKIRQAISMAINRDVLSKFIRKDGSTGAFAYVPPGTAGNKGETFREEFGSNFLKFNIEKAKKLLKEGLKEINFTGTMKVTLLLDQTDDRRRDAQFIQEELHKNLGIDVTLEPNTFQSRLQKSLSRNYDFVYGGWLPDYNDPLTYIELWYSTGGNNHSGWSNTEFDKLVDTASSSNDNKIRMNAMAKAEQIMLKELPVIPLYYSPANWLIKKDLKNVILRPVGLSPEFTYAYWK